MGLNAAERETTLTIDDAEQMWLVSSFRRADITRLKKNPDLIIEEEGTFEGTPFLRGKLPMGGIAIRAKSAGTIKRTSTTKKPTGMPANAQKCGYPKANGEPCGAIASKETGRCPRHKDKE